jgi:pyocin large subunit-like protein
VPTVGKNLMSETTLYNIRTNEFAVGSSEGTVRTLFRPKDGIHYWNKQVGATP